MTLSSLHLASRIADPTAPLNSLAYVIQMARKTAPHGSQDTKRKTLCLGYLDSDYDQLVATILLPDRITWVKSAIAPWSVIWFWVANVMGIPEDLRVKHEDMRHRRHRESSLRLKIKRLSGGSP